jgi:hypothetical protein
MGVLSNEMGQGFSYGWLGNGGSLSTTNTDLNAAFVFNTSGTAIGIRFTSPVTQTNGSLKIGLYMGAKTGTPTDIQLDIYPGPSGADDPQRPGTSGVLGTVTGVDLSGIAAPSWVYFTVASVSLTQGATYWAVFSNNTGTQASNFPSFRNRAINGLDGSRISMWQTTTGFTTDPTRQGSALTECPCMFKFADGTLMGQPYVLTTANASNTADRGVGFKFSQPIKIAGIQAVTPPSGATHLIVYDGATAIADLTLDLSQRNNAATQILLFKDGPITFHPGKRYDVMWTGIGASTTTFARVNTGVGADTDTLDLTFQNQWHVTGTVPGSYTVTANSTGPIILVPDSLLQTGFFIQ